MKKRIKITFLNSVRITFLFLLLLFCYSANGNNYSNNKITIDTEFSTGNLGDTITSLHTNLSDIQYLYVRVGTLNNVDIFWIRDNLVNLAIINIWDEAILLNNRLPDNAFINHKNIKNCYFENATSVGKNAFKGCSNLFDVRFIQLTNIGDSAFAGCNYFCKLVVNSAIAPEVGEGAFEDCYYYRQFRLPFEGKIACQAVNDGNTTDDYWFGFELLVPFGNHVKIEQTFTTGKLSESISALRNDLEAITKLTITKGVLNTQDVYWIRDSLPNLENLTINEDALFSNGGLPENAFKNHNNLQFANVSNATFIGNNAFENCINLVTIYAYSATSLGDYSFKNCFNFNQLYPHKTSPPFLGTGTFEGCTASGKVIDGTSNFSAYQAVNDGNIDDNFWYDWKIDIGGSTVIRVNTDEGGNIDWGKPSSWDTIYENVNGAAFWNGEDWVVNDTYGHMYFEDLRVAGLRIGNYGGINYQIPANPTISEGRIIEGYFISVEDYNYTINATGGGKYEYVGIKYIVEQPDETSIVAYSRGNGNGIDSTYFDIVLEDNSPGPGITTFREGGVVSDATGFTLEEAINNPLIDSLVMGRLVTTDLTNHRNRYFIDTNGGDEMGGMSYILKTIFLPESKTIETYEKAKTYITELSVNFKNNEGELESFKISPLLISESYSPPTSISNQIIEPNEEDILILYPNPTQGKFRVKNEKFKVEDATIELYDFTGRQLLEKQIPTETENVEIDVSHLKNGVYFCRLFSEKYSATKKLIIQK